MAVVKQDKSFVEAVVTSASQGAAGAVIGAFLAAVTDPFTNRLLVKRMTMTEAINDIELKACVEYFKTTLPTNFIKFPIFEVLNTVVQRLPPESRAIVAGAIFTSVTLPLTNYRFAKSIGQEVSTKNLFKAFLPTVIRDIVYAQARNSFSGQLAKSYPDLQKSPEGKVLGMFLTVVFACLVSSPGNEWRGYTLQPADRKKTPAEFFQLERYLRSTIIGALVMGTSLGLSTLVGPRFQELLTKHKKMILLVMVMGFLARALKDQQDKKNDTNKEQKRR